VKNRVHDLQRQRSRLQHELLHELIRKYRQHAGLSQSELGFLLGRDQTYVAKLEAGNRKIPFETLEQIAEIVDQPITAFQTLATFEGNWKLTLRHELREFYLTQYRRGIYSRKRSRKQR
jgi:transcriptional regulator with XRE-family HTH domain